MKFTDQQLQAIELASSAIQSKKELYRVGGFAGTGKTTILRQVYEQNPNGAIIAFAGKACDVLRRKGLPGRTIHSLIYKWDEASRRFYLVPSLDHVDWIGIDEGSMVGNALWSDLCSFKRPTLVIGDPGQLEPVADEDPHLMRCPDFTLTEVHRQALDNPIIKLSMQIREGDDVNWRPFQVPKNSITDEEMILWPDMIVCGYNKTRVSLNGTIRQFKKFRKHRLNEGERIICKQNDPTLGVFNGQMFTVTKVRAPESIGVECCDLVTDSGEMYHEAKIVDIGFNCQRRPAWKAVKPHQGRRMICDYGSVITCHGAQGSEYDKVLYVDEQSDLWCPIRHRYTGVTRAAQELRVAIDPHAQW